MSHRCTALAAGLVVAGACAALAAEVVTTRVEVKSPEMSRILRPGTPVERIAGGFKFTEGPVWTRQGQLLFSDIPNDVVQQWDPKSGKLSAYRQPSGQTNGNTLDAKGRLICCEHTGRRVSVREADGTYRTLAERYDGKRLSSPNDVVVKSDGSIYFTDPPYGLTKGDEDPAKEVKSNGVYRLKDGKLVLLTAELSRPNGLAFSPDERKLYVANSDEKRKLWMEYPVNQDGSLGAGRVFYDVTTETAPGLPDGMKVDRAGNVYGTGPGGLWVFNARGEHLGTLKLPEIPANCAWGDDAHTLYLTAQTSVYRVRLSTQGKLP